MALRHTSSVEMRTPAILSAGVHVVALVLVIANFDWFRSPPIEPEPIMVDFVAIDKHAAAPKIGVQDPQPEKAKIAEETSKAPPPKTAEPQPTPEPPKKEVAEAKPIAPAPVEKPKPEPPKPTEDVVALKPKQPEPPKEEKKIEPPKPEPPKPEVKKVEPPKPPPKPPEPKKPNVDALVDSILKNNDKNPPIKTPQQSPQRPKEITRQAAVAPQLSSVVTASQIEGVRSKIRPCWNPTPGAREQPIVTLTVEMNQDGTPVKAEIQDTGRYNRDQVFRSAADAAYRAVMNPRCQPWPLPPDSYNNGWRTITFNFDPRDY